MRSLHCLVAFVAVVSAADAGEIIKADGRRQPVTDPRQDAKGNWMGTVDGRRSPLKPGDVVVVIDDAGKETVTIPELPDTLAPTETAALLADLRSAKNAIECLPIIEQLAAQRTKGVHDALVALTTDAKKPMRERAIRALAGLRTRESVLAAATAILAEKDKVLRREAASALFAVSEIFKRSESAELVKAGLADTERDVRCVFAMLAPKDDAAALAVLKADGLKHPDHHVRESSAVELGRRGDKSGESVLIGMLGWTKLDVSNDPAFNDRMLAEQQEEVCAILGTFGTATAKAALEKAKTSRLESVRKAAEAALAQQETK
jgi:hypothetical protein